MPYTSSPGNCNDKFDAGKLLQANQYVRSAPGQDRSFLVSVFGVQSISYLGCIYIIYSVGRLKPHTGGFVCFST